MNPTAFRVGSGFDAHKFASGRALVLGGVTVPYDRGLEGHSDADVLTHALCDAILGAIGAGDIGRHFPDDDPRFKDVSSLSLLEQTVAMAREHGWRVINADLTLIMQEPKIARYAAAMVGRLGEVLGPDAAVNVKATTTEGMGFTGRGDGAAAQAVVLLGGTSKSRTGRTGRTSRTGRTGQTSS